MEVELPAFKGLPAALVFPNFPTFVMWIFAGGLMKSDEELMVKMEEYYAIEETLDAQQRAPSLWCVDDGRWEPECR